MAFRFLRGRLLIVLPKFMMPELMAVLPDSAFTRDDRYRADTRQGVAVEYIPKLA